MSKRRSRASRRRRTEERRRGEAHSRQSGPTTSPFRSSRLWLREPPGRLLTITAAIGAGAATVWGAWYATTTARNQVVAAVGLEVFAFTDTPPLSPDVRGLAVSNAVVNTTEAPFLVVGAEFRFRGRTHPVSYVTPGNCSGAPVRLEPANPVFIDIFVDGLTSAEIHELARSPRTWSLRLALADGRRVEARPSIPTAAIEALYEEDFPNLGAECPNFP